MSNWSSVIIAWSGIDDIAEENVRTTEIQAEYEKIKYGWFGTRLSPSCSKESIGSACEVVLLMHANHFNVEGMIRLLRGMKWEYPEHVELFYKSEHDENYQVIRVFDEKTWPHWMSKEPPTP